MKMLLIAAALVPASTAALAQDDASDLRVRIGAGAQTRPTFIGADGNDVIPLVRVDVAREGREFRFGAPDDGFDVQLFARGGFAVGPVGYLQSRRRNRDAGVAIGEVKRTIEAGGFVEYVLNDSVRLRGELRKGIGGHEGLVGQVGIDKIWRDGDKYVFSVGPRVLFSNARFQRAYFGVSPAAALATGLPAYRPGGGLHAVALASGLNVDLGRRFGLFGFARGERLVGDARRSPFIRSYGSRNQLSAGIGLNYTFPVRR
jgi:outer membrane protein